ncbi:hypothetical protein PG996_014948 [Apiospora saccharicola]|uniref:Tat pathway signal sequence n=1 Tax=Apiospora saccharicola TaxID=335842 RepID=A0ABR1TJS9_9PEZI
MSTRTNQFQYESLDPSDPDPNEDVGFLGDKQRALRHSYSHQARKLLFITVINLLFFVVSCVLCGTWYYNVHTRKNGALRQASSYSPILDMLDLDLSVQIMNGTLFQPKDGGSIARQMPNPESDTVWSEYELTRYFPVSAAQIRAMGKDPATVAKLEDEDWGMGDDSYVSILDVYHQLHCLNTLRQLAYPEYYSNATYQHPKTMGSEKRGKKQKSEILAIHVNHCVDMLMQAIQCSGNVNLITMHWVEEQPYPFPDMSVNRQCINFDKLSQWRKDNTLDMDKYVETMRKKEGKHFNQLKAPDAYYEYYMPDVVNPNHLNGANPGEDFNL